MTNEIITGLAVLRVLPLAILMFYSIRHKDKTAIMIALLWATALVAGSFLDNREASQIIASPLVVLVVYYIVKSQQK